MTSKDGQPIIITLLKMVGKWPQGAEILRLIFNNSDKLEIMTNYEIVNKDFSMKLSLINSLVSIIIKCVDSCFYFKRAIEN